MYEPGKKSTTPIQNSSVRFMPNESEMLENSSMHQLITKSTSISTSTTMLCSRTKPISSFLIKKVLCGLLPEILIVS